MTRQQTLRERFDEIYLNGDSMLDFLEQEIDKARQEGYDQGRKDEYEMNKFVKTQININTP